MINHPPTYLNLERLLALWSNQPQAIEGMTALLSEEFLDHLFFAEAHRHAPPVTIVKAGSALTKLCAPDFEGRDLLSLVQKSDQPLLWGMLNAVTTQGNPASIKLDVRSRVASGEDLVFGADLVIAPLGGGVGTSRWLGYLQFSNSTPMPGSVYAFDFLELRPPRAQRLTA